MGFGFLVFKGVGSTPLSSVGVGACVAGGGFVGVGALVG